MLCACAAACEEPPPEDAPEPPVPWEVSERLELTRQAKWPFEDFQLSLRREPFSDAWRDALLFEQTKHLTLHGVLTQGEVDFADVIDERRLTLETDDGQLWSMGFTVTGGYQYYTLDISLPLGKPIQLDYTAIDFGVFRHVALRIDDADGPLLVTDSGVDPWGPPFSPVHVGPLTESADSCGIFTTYALLFRDDPPVLVAPGESGVLNIGRHRYRVLNSHASGVLNPSNKCRDVVGGYSWTAWRLPDGAGK